MPRLGPYSQSATLAKLDRRSKPARLMASLRRELIVHVGGMPSITQTLLIDQACSLQLRLALMDADNDKVGTMTERNQVQYLAWSGSLQRVLNQIGLTAAPAPKPRWQPPIDQPTTSPTAASARSERLAQRAAELAEAK
jgi:hypothetical protein